MANGHGGSRPGAGQKKKLTADQQARNRDLVLATITQDHLLKMTLTAVNGAIEGDPASRNWVTSFVLGNPEHVIKHMGDPDNPLQILVQMINDRA